jgi:UDP-N-acetylmuramyl pentapeptide phosphotransferase/UDP-N-acetylglucosamine-1-phosphate transferase
MPDAPWGGTVGSWIGIFFLVALAGTWLARRYAISRQLLDEPGERRSHSTPTPRGGGISIVVAMLFAIGCLAVRDPATAPALYAIACGLLLVAGIGWIDDHRPLSPLLRLVIQTVAALLLGWAVSEMGGDRFAATTSAVLALILVNVWNFMDGIDGLAGSQALLVAIAYGVLAGSGPPAWLAMALAASCLGFLPFNMPHARIFLGDVGSGALGFLVATLVAWTVVLPHEGWRAWAMLLPLSAFIVDASLTLLLRMFRRQRWWLPHAEHAYQHWARRRGHVLVTLAYGGWTATMILFMLAASARSLAFNMLTLAVAGLGGTVAWILLRRGDRRIERRNRE